MHEALPGEFYISRDILEQAQIEGALYLRALGALMDEMQNINSETKVIPYIHRFAFLYEKISVRVMLILGGSIDMDKIENLSILYDTSKKFEYNQKYLDSMVKCSNGSSLVSAFIVACNYKRWLKDICILSDVIYSDILEGEDNKIYLSSK